VTPHTFRVGSILAFPKCWLNVGRQPDRMSIGDLVCLPCSQGLTAPPWAKEDVPLLSSEEGWGEMKCDGCGKRFADIQAAPVTYEGSEAEVPAEYASDQRADDVLHVFGRTHFARDVHKKGRGKRCGCAHGIHQRISPEEKQYLLNVVHWLAHAWKPNPSFTVASMAIACDMGISLHALSRAMGLFTHHDAPLVSEWISRHRDKSPKTTENQ